MYRFPEYEEVNKTHFFRFEKDIVRCGDWARLPTASKAIFPVIGVHANADGVAWPSQETIARMAGITPKTVRVGIEGLKGLQMVKLTPKINSRGHKKYMYKIKLPEVGKRKDFWFYRSLIESGFWASLTQGEQAVYPVLRTFAYFEPQAYFAYCDELGINVPEDIDYGNFLSEGYYEKRQFEIAMPEVDVVAETAGLTVRTTKKAINSLEDKKMVYVYDRDSYYCDEDEITKEYIVFIKPRYWVADNDRTVTYAFLNRLNENITHE